MRLTYDPEVDAIYIYLGRKSRSYRTEELHDRRSFRLVDYGRDGEPIGIEVLGTKNGIRVSTLPRASEVARLLKEHGFRVLDAPENRKRHLKGRRVMPKFKAGDPIKIGDTNGIVFQVSSPTSYNTGIPKYDPQTEEPLYLVLLEGASELVICRQGMIELRG